VTETPTRMFDRDTTAAEVVQGVNLSGKLAVVTGGSEGLGLETARALRSAGADLFIGARSADKLTAAATQLRGEPAGGTVFTHPLDLMAPASVDAFADAVLALDRPVDILVNNAGIMAAPKAYTAEGIESQLATNFVGHAQLTSRLAGALAAASGARLVSLTSSGHQISPVLFDDPNFERAHYEPFVAYGQSKTACALLAVKAARHLGGRGVTAHAVHPGMIETDLGRFITDEDRARMAAAMGDHARQMPKFKTIEAGAATSVWAATADELAGKPPLYLEDCHVADRIDTRNFAHGVLPYALDEDAADKIWTAAETMLGRPLPL